MSGTRPEPIGLAEPATTTRTNGRSPEASGGEERRASFRRWAARHNGVLTIASASIAPILYLVFISTYAVNSLQSDDWSMVPLAHAALHNQLSFAQVWDQHNESRLVLGNLVGVVFGVTDRLDARAIIFFNAAVFLVTYALLLLLVGKYLRKGLTPLTVIVVGILWFSLADVQNELWAFQVSWYLTLLCFVAMTFALLVPERHRRWWLAVAVVAAVAGSLSTVQGFLCWPLGAVCILWRGWTRQARPEIVAWLIATVATLVAYLPGYRFSQGNTCLVSARCTVAYESHHPLTVLGFFFGLMGNVVPGTLSETATSTPNGARYILVGVALFVTSLYVLVQSWRHRVGDEAMPLPALLIGFGLLFDLTLVVGRGGAGLPEAVGFNRYVMANLVLLIGVVVYALARVPATLRRPAGSEPWKLYVKYAALAAVSIFVVVQVAEATNFGISNGQSTRAERNALAGTFVNLRPACDRYMMMVFRQPVTALAEMAEDHLGEFGPTTFQYYRELGAPFSTKPNPCLLPPD